MNEETLKSFVIHEEPRLEKIVSFGGNLDLLPLLELMVFLDTEKRTQAVG